MRCASELYTSSKKQFRLIKNVSDSNFSTFAGTHYLVDIYTMKALILFIYSILFVISAQAQNAERLVRANLKLTDALVEDVFSPPVASRIYVYPNIASYEVLCLQNSNLQTLSGQIPHFKSIPKPENAETNLSLAASLAFLHVAKKLVYSEYMMDSLMAEEIREAQSKGMDESVAQASRMYAQQVAKHIIDWMNEDNYIYTRTLERYVLADSPGAWKPTAPEYANALEPNWPFMRSFVFNKSEYSKAIPNVAYSENKQSVYYKNALALYRNSQRKDSNHIKTALYWDDNPNTSVVNGHLTYFIHKISPPGHWMSITTQCIRERKLTEVQAAELLTMVSLSLYEGFLSCWTEKFKSNAVRPETYIHKLIDPVWKPLIETPPFPEYTSGHSVISAAAASMLTYYLPKPHAFTDSTQTYLSLPPRKYVSFLAAADEASVSRFYGGIHFMPALNNGNKQGRDVSAYILKKLHTRRNP